MKSEDFARSRQDTPKAGKAWFRRTVHARNPYSRLPFHAELSGDGLAKTENVIVF